MTVSDARFTQALTDAAFSMGSSFGSHLGLHYQRHYIKLIKREFACPMFAKKKSHLNILFFLSWQTWMSKFFIQRFFL